MMDIKKINFFILGFTFGFFLIIIFYFSFFFETQSSYMKDNSNLLLNEENLVNISSLPPEDFLYILKNSDEIILIDIRTKEEFYENHISGAINIDFYGNNFRENLNKLDKNLNYLIYCRSGSRTSQTLLLMEELGFKNVFDLDGGIISLIS